MNPNKPASPELMALLPALAETMKFATQALAEATALADVLIEKGVVTKAELDGKMKSAQKLKDSLMAILDDGIRKQS